MAIAYKWQQTLRSRLLASGEMWIDLTDSDEVPWRMMIDQMKLQDRQTTEGSGVSNFSFRLLPNVEDHNYSGKVDGDSGERHVFEIRRTDGSRCHLHYHKNRKMDRPKVYPATYELVSDVVVGRLETQRALDALLASIAPGGLSPAAVDITDGIAFDWRRWIMHLEQEVVLRGGGIQSVFAVRWKQGGCPEIGINRTNGSFCSIKPSNQQYKDKINRSVNPITEWGPTSQLCVLWTAVVGDTSWLRIGQSSGDGQRHNQERAADPFVAAASQVTPLERQALCMTSVDEPVGFQEGPLGPIQKELDDRQKLDMQIDLLTSMVQEMEEDLDSRETRQA